MPRIKELDFLKGVLILLVISFHLVWFEQLHPDIKQVVYCFHMPGFLLISGYLMNISKEPRQFLRTLLWLAVPYVVMESGYIYMASILPINEHIAQLTPWVYLKHLFLHPLGPYWYLHAIILCGATYYYIYNNVEKSPVTRFLLIGIAYYILARIFGILSFSSSLYFLAGACLRQSGMNFVAFFLPSRLSVIVFALLACFSAGPTQASLNGVLIAYFAISSLLSIYKYLPPAPRPLLLFLGRNSLPLYVFSPIFTVLCKQLVPYLKFDPTGLLFLVVSLTFCVTGSLLIAWLMDLVGISKYFFGRRALN
ncbi:MAG: acyltransferase family protein [Bacteroidaceae bacterium]|nr:acyltransferase family protein [Bacteroidaceae bacterium]